ncbi:MAG TPA: hypothetical protein VGF91_15310 [Solirubrobacteraceae bacterium]
MSADENRERYLGVRIPPTNLRADYLQHAHAFPQGLADGLGHNRQTGSALPTKAPNEQPNEQPTDTTKASTHE